MKQIWKIGIYLGLCWLLPRPITGQNIQIERNPTLVSNSTVELAVNDVSQLLAKAFDCVVSESDENAAIRIVLPTLDPAAEKLPSHWELDAHYPYFHYPNRDFVWSATSVAGQRVLTLNASTSRGVADGLYALLQEKLGFAFYHPRETIIPHWVEWPLPDQWTFAGKPGFDKMGFHLHTQHPLELTEALHNHRLGEKGLAQIREYMDWLARNGQNFFEFCLLEGIDLKHWPDYAAQFTAYAHSRGILASVDLSLHMFQQKAFQLVRFPPKSLRGFEKQIDLRLDALMRANWDFVNMEFSIGEFVGGLEGLRERLREHVVEKLAQDYPETKLMGREHVVKHTDEIGGSHSIDPVSDTTNPARGVLVHTVMGYGVDWEKAPVYESENLRHMLPILDSQKHIRETWFYPESAYWITFDNSIPIFFLPYLQARCDDIQLMKSKDIAGHITFSSGWEWGYWLVDWSIARWSWDYKMDGEIVEHAPTSALNLIPDNEGYSGAIKRLVDVEMEFLVEKEGMKLLTASTMTDELPFGMNKQFMPRPDFSYKWLVKKATAAQVDSVERVVQVLDIFREAIWEAMGPEPEKGEISPYAPMNQLIRAVEVTEMRAEFRSLIFKALIAKARKRLKLPTEDPKDLLVEAESVRQRGVEWVRAMEATYRYPVEDIAGKHRTYTAYRFGYLWSTHDLFFWEREIKQAKRGRWGPLYMNIWDALTIAGLRD